MQRTANERADKTALSLKFLLKLSYKGVVFNFSDRWQVSRWQENVNHPNLTTKSRKKSDLFLSIIFRVILSSAETGIPLCP